MASETTDHNLNGYSDLATAYRIALKRVAALKRTKADKEEIAEACAQRDRLAADLSKETSAL